MEVIKEITLDYLEKLDKGLIKDKNGRTIKMCDLTNDKVFKIFFKSNIRILKRFIVSVLHFEYINPDDIKIRFIDKEMLEINQESHKNVYDYYININDSIYLDVEMNKSYFEIVKNKSYIYESRMISNSLIESEEYENFSNKKYIQLNLNSKEKQNKYGEEIIYPYNITTNKIYMENVITYLRYLEYYRKKYYTNISDMKESDYWLLMLTSKNFSELYMILDLFLQPEIKNQIIREVVDISMKNLFTEQELINLEKQVEMDREKYYKKVGIEEGRNQGIKQGIEQGIEQGKIEGSKERAFEIAKNLLNENVSLDLIAKTTNLSIKELENLRSN